MLLLTSQVLQRSQEAENKTLSGREGMRDTYLATRACGGAGRRLGCCRSSAEIGESDLLGVAGHPVQELLGGVEGSDVTRDEYGLPGEVYDRGHAGPVRVEARGVLLEPLRGLQQAFVLFAVKLVDGRERHGSTFAHLWKTTSKLKEAGVHLGLLYL